MCCVWREVLGSGGRREGVFLGIIFIDFVLFGEKKKKLSIKVILKELSYNSGV